MNFHTNSESKKNDKTTGLLQGKDSLLYYSKSNSLSERSEYHNLEESSTSENSFASFSRNSTVIDKSDFGNSGQIIDINAPSSTYNEALQLSELSKIGYVKLGFWKLSKINPVARYNFYIERYNEEINQYNNIKLKTIPMNKYVSKIFDIYTLYCRILLGIYLIIYSSIAKSYNLQSYKYYHYYNIDGSEESSIWAYEKNRNRIFIIFSIICILINFLLAIYLFWVIFAIVSFITLGMIFSMYYVRKNSKKIKNNFYRNMIFDEELDKTSKLNDYILINPGTVEEYLGCPYYTFLLFLYRKRDTTIPQHFMLYGNNYKYEKGVVWDALIYHLIYLAGMVLVVSIIYLL